ncbi:hypothetical protein SynBIOSE41_02951 [Synechococcus sp. BIOS-E4-1]|nr:hypothetical protein SynBIOSE41_02951 [Synechococcus sp. BIOS-E4-1]
MFEQHEIKCVQCLGSKQILITLSEGLRLKSESPLNPE